MYLARVALLCGMLGAVGLTACGGDNPNIRPVRDTEYNDYRNQDKGKLGGDAGLVFGVGKGTGGSQG